MNLKLLSALSAFAVTGAVSQASVFSIDDFTFTFNSEVSVVDANTYYQVRWGTYSGDTFSPMLGAAVSDDDTGFLSVADGQISASINLGNNDSIPAGNLFYLAITLLDYESPYVSSQNEVILTDPTWIAPTFALVAPPVSVSFTENTTALKGTYSFNGGNDIITVGAIPEPSTFAAIAGLAVVGAVATRRRRSA